MKEIFGDLFEQHDADAICITTNKTIKKNMEAVMGQGCALEANKRWKLAKKLGSLLLENTDELIRFTLKDEDYDVIAFPVKDHWRDKADIAMITESALKLRTLANICQWKKVVIPRPGCGLGKLSWKTQVKPVLKPILDDRFFIIHFSKEKSCQR
jgi:hypothetical protein